MRRKDRGLAWISVNPGEYRSEPPDPPCEVREFPDQTPSIRSRELLLSVIAACERAGPLSQRETRLIEAGREAYADGLAGRPVAPAVADGLRAAPAIASEGELAKFSRRACDDLLLDYRIGVKDFTYIMVIIAVQRWLGVRANWDWSADPKTSLEKLIAMLLAHSDVSRMKLVAFSTRTCQPTLRVRASPLGRGTRLGNNAGDVQTLAAGIPPFSRS